MDRTLKERSWLYKNAANIVTGIGYIATFIFIVMIVAGSENLWWVFFFLLIAVLSDYFDGIIARALDIVSRAGDFLDRMRDKILIGGIAYLLFYFLLPHRISETVKLATEGLIWTIIFFETLLIICAIYGGLKGLTISANKWGKRKMGFESVTVLVWFLVTIIDKYHYFDCYFGTKVYFIDFAIYLIDWGFAMAIVLAVSSIKGYWENYFPKNNI